MSNKAPFLFLFTTLLLGLALFGGNESARSATPTDIVTLNPIKDATIVSGLPNNSNTGISIGNHATDGEFRSLLQFDLASIPANSTIVSATLELYMIINLQAEAGNTAVTSHRLLSSWTEATVTWNNAPSFAPTVDPSTNVVLSSWVQFDVSNLVDDWVTGGATNHGLLMQGDGTLGVYSFFSRESATFKPRLHVSYVSNTPTSTATTPPGSTATHTPMPGACPGTIVLQPDADTRILAGAPGSNFGTQNRLDVGRDMADRQYTLLHFPVESALGSNEYVHDAYLRLHVQDTDAGLQPPWPISLYTLKSGFGETAVTWNNQPGFADYVKTISVNDTAQHQINGLGALVEGWNSGDINNTGLAIAASAGDFVLKYDSREGSSPPELVITCSNQPPNDPTPTPLPTTCNNPITLYATQDAMSNQNYTDWTYGTDLGVKIGRANGLKYGYLRFPIEQLPAGYHIYSAELQMDVQRWDGDGRSFISSSLFRVTNNAWNEANLTWDNAPTAVNSTPNTLNYDIYNTHTWNVLDDVRTWYHNQAPNHGLFIRSADPVLVTYDSRESGNPARLVIECGTAVPTITPTFTPTPTATPSPTPSPTPAPVDFVAEAIEITQGLQNLQNDIELIAGKTTYVHFFGRVRQNGQFIDLNNNFMAVMEATRNGEEIGFGGVKAPLEVPDSLKAAGWNRETDGFLFKMPSSWSSEAGDIELTVRFLTINEPSGNWGNNAITMTVTFVDTPPICNVYSPVRTSSGHPHPDTMSSSVGGYNVRQRARSLLPTSAILALQTG